MAEVLLFNHALGVTEGVQAFADRLRGGGHQVTVGDLFQGQTFDDIETGVAYEESIGWEEMKARSEAIARAAPAGRSSIGGFSLGAVYAQRLAQTREGALGALLYHAGDVPAAEFGAPWPDGRRAAGPRRRGGPVVQPRGRRRSSSPRRAASSSSTRAPGTCSPTARGRSTTRRLPTS